ncbi:uncharacterized protein LOC100899657 [Galendromus occidentalis]|uniref:Uncharacterized protein LOC100899657 n=1 Tax=Galendromus occidentalis TaxID=34638 RepID=A0AAJ6QWW8_9ACAR|nr:uncharacterized protein LOC100899657 [Galendromus occidentalis]
MEISQQTSPQTGTSDNLKENTASIAQEENGNVATNIDENILAATDKKGSRQVDDFFSQQARGDIPSPIKPETAKADATMESLDLKLDDTSPRKPQSACIQPQDVSTDLTDMFEVNILETSAETASSKVDADQTQTELMNESASSRKRPQTEMEPAVFEVPRMSKHPHTDSPPLPEFHEDSEPLIKFSSDSESVFRVALSGGNADDSVEPMSFQENSCIQRSGDKLEDSDAGSATYIINSDSVSGEIETGNDVLQGGAMSSSDAGATDDTAAASSKKTENGSGASVGLSLLKSIDEALDPLVRVFLPVIRRKPGLNTAVVCIPLVVASIVYFYLRH